MVPTIFQSRLKRFWKVDPIFWPPRILRLFWLHVIFSIGCTIIIHTLVPSITPTLSHEPMDNVDSPHSLRGRTITEGLDRDERTSNELISNEPLNNESRPRESNIPSPEQFPVELEWLTSEGLTPRDGVLTSRMISPAGLTSPSLWWIQQQVGGKVLHGWIAYPEPRHAPPYVDLVVNRQLWGLSDYLERYSFVHHFGQAAASFGYAIRVFNNVGDYLAAYPCVWASAPRFEEGDDIDDTNETSVHQHPEPLSTPRSCSIIVDSSGIGVRRENDFTSF